MIRAFFGRCLGCRVMRHDCRHYADRRRGRLEPIVLCEDCAHDAVMPLGAVLETDWRPEDGTTEPCDRGR